MTDEVPDAYTLLSRPTLDFTDAEVDIVIADLRRRRAAFVATGKPDKIAKPKVAASPASAEAKASNTASILAMLKLTKD